MQKTPLSIRIIYILSRIIYFITVLICLLGIVVSTFLFTGRGLDKLDMSISLPIKSSSEQIGKTTFYGQEMGVIFGDAKGKVNFSDVPKSLARTFAILTLLMLSIIFFLVTLFCRFIKNVYTGIIFEIDNFIILRKLGIVLLGLYFYVLITTQLFKRGFSLGQVNSDLSLTLCGGTIPLLIGALFLLMLSQIFMRGLELKEENKLTI